MSVPVLQADSTYAAIERKIRRLTASASQSSLSSADIQQYVNTFYSQDFAYGIKLDQMRSVYTFYTVPNVDRYPLDVNYNQGVRAPVYFEGIGGSFFKDRQQFYNLFPRFPTQFKIGGETLTGTITAIAQPTNPTSVTSPSHNLITGAVITINNVVGMTQLNGNVYTITVVDANTFTLNGIDNTTFGAYVSGGDWTATSQTFSFLLPGPFLSKEVVIGGISATNSPISIADDGNGVLQLLNPNPATITPPQNQFPMAPIPGMLNRNLGNPGLISPLNIGLVDYVTGQIDFTLPPSVSLQAGTLFNIWVSQYQVGRPYCLLFWNNEFTIRPVPDFSYKVECETYLTPVQFLQSSDNPILNQWWQYIAIGAAIKVLEDRQDMEGVENLSLLFDRQEALVLERQGIEEIGQPNFTIFNSTSQNYINGGFGQGGFW